MLCNISNIKLSQFPSLKSAKWWFFSITAVQADVLVACFGFPMCDLCPVLRFLGTTAASFPPFLCYSLIPDTSLTFYLLSAAISEERDQLLLFPSILWAPQTGASRYRKKHDDLLQMSWVAPLAPLGLGGTDCSCITRGVQRGIGNFSSQHIPPLGKGHLP